jgi:hypothetical protein
VRNELGELSYFGNCNLRNDLGNGFNVAFEMSGLIYEWSFCVGCNMRTLLGKGRYFGCCNLRNDLGNGVNVGVVMCGLIYGMDLLLVL